MFQQGYINEKTMFKLFLFGVIAVAAAILPDAIWAAGLIDQQANVEGQTKAAASITKQLVLLVGFLLFVGGLGVMSVAKKQNIPASTWGTMLVVGILMMSITLVIGIGSGTLLDGEQSGSALNDLGL